MLANNTQNVHDVSGGDWVGPHALALVGMVLKSRFAVDVTTTEDGGEEWTFAGATVHYKPKTWLQCMATMGTAASEDLHAEIIERRVRFPMQKSAWPTEGGMICRGRGRGAAPRRGQGERARSQSQELLHAPPRLRQELMMSARRARAGWGQASLHAPHLSRPSYRRACVEIVRDRFLSDSYTSMSQSPRTQSVSDAGPVGGFHIWGRGIEYFTISTGTSITLKVPLDA
jgi:hypothetical protein